MFQGFDAATSPADGPPRLSRLRSALNDAGLDGFLVPRADAHQGEYVAPGDERLSWLTGFAGSAGFCAVLPQIAGVFIDGRYTVQVRSQVDTAHFTPVPWPATQLGPWLVENLPDGGVVGFDPWLHTRTEIDKLITATQAANITLKPVANMIDAIWDDRPAPPQGPIHAHPLEFAGEPHDDKIARLASGLASDGTDHAIITLPDSIAWLLNVRGSDIVRNPVPHAFAVLNADATIDLFVDPAKLSEDVTTHLGTRVRLHPIAAFADHQKTLHGSVLLDENSAPFALMDAVSNATVMWGRDPCVFPKARKNAAELNGMRAAHLRDAVAMVKFLCWLDDETPKGTLTEIDVVKALEAFRRADNTLRDISFETISGSGPNGAIVHYRVTNDTNRTITPGELLLVDSGGQYLDGTTDITRTVATGPVDAMEKRCFTKVLQGMIAVSRARWPEGLAGRDLDALARFPLWTAGMDYDHGTGHGVGAYLCVHEGPHGLSRRSVVPLEPGMIVSNEPGYYREGAFGIRIENLVAVEPAPPLPDQDTRTMLSFETLTFVPIDLRLVDNDLLSGDERAWINSYHTQVRDQLLSALGPKEQAWLQAATVAL
jgi:Xaa-Pro aminopeptidase